MRNNRKLVYSSLFSLLTLGIILLIIISTSKKTSLQVAFLDVGQGDSILISEGDQQILIDGGIALNNGSKFGSGGEGYFRLNFGCPKSTLEKGLEILEKALIDVK